MGGSYSLRWTTAPIEGSQQLVISPRNGRSYIVNTDSDEYNHFLRIAGLDENARADNFDYMSSLTYVSLSSAQRSRPRGYFTATLIFKLVNSLRTIISPKILVSLAVKLGHLKLFHISSADEALQLVRSVEKDSDPGSCFARSVLLFALATQAGLAASMYIGVLAPCTKMHAWTVIDNSILYEPVPEHWMYYPVLRFRLK
ncbi:MAG: lasso peptide biosynthesis protein [bacterium]